MAEFVVEVFENSPKYDPATVVSSPSQQCMRIEGPSICVLLLDKLSKSLRVELSACINHLSLCGDLPYLSLMYLFRVELLDILI